MERLTLTKEQRASEKVGYAKYFSEKLCQKIDEKLAHYEDLEESGRLVVLPCKVGDTVYVIQNPKDVHGNIHIGTHIQRVINEHEFFMGMYSEFGKTVFLTKEDAERALAEREKS